MKTKLSWPFMPRDTREYVLSCGCRRKKRSRSQRVAMLPARFLQPSEVLDKDFRSGAHTSAEGNKYLLLVVDKVSRFLFAYPLRTREADREARHLFDLCLSFGVPACIRAGGWGEFTATVIKFFLWIFFFFVDFCGWLRVTIEYGPVDHARGQRAVERAGAWLHDVLSELCKSWPTGWDKYVAPACWIKRTMPDPAQPSTMTPFHFLFGRSPRTPLDAIVPRMDDTELTGGLDTFVGQRRHTFREVRDALERTHNAREATCQRRNANILWHRQG